MINKYNKDYKMMKEIGLCDKIYDCCWINILKQLIKTLDVTLVV